MFHEFDETLSIRRPINAPAVQLIVLAGASLLVAATFIPTNGGGRAGYPYAIFDTSIQREFQLFAAEPVAVAILAAGAALFLLRHMPSLTAGVLLAFGVQNFVLFLAYVGIAAFGNPQYNSFRPGGLIGVFGALLLIAGGSLALRAAMRTPRPVAGRSG
jgi:hypothetical protein